MHIFFIDSLIFVDGLQVIKFRFKTVLLFLYKQHEFIRLTWLYLHYVSFFCASAECKHERVKSWVCVGLHGILKWFQMRKKELHDILLQTTAAIVSFLCLCSVYCLFTLWTVPLHDIATHKLMKSHDTITCIFVMYM